MMRSALQKFTLACLPLLFAFCVFATNLSALADTNFIDPTITDDNAAAKQLTEILKKHGVKVSSVLDEHFLFASIIWSAVAGGYLLYARRQRETTPFIGGMVMMVVSFLIASWFWMSLVCLAIILAVYWLMRNGY